MSDSNKCFNHRASMVNRIDVDYSRWQDANVCSPAIKKKKQKQNQLMIIGLRHHNTSKD